MCDQENSTDDADDAEDGYEIFFLTPAANAYDMATKVREANEALVSENTSSTTRIQSRKVTFREGNLASYADEVSTDDVSDVTSISDDEELCWGQADPTVPLQKPIVDGNSTSTTETHFDMLERWSPFVQDQDSQVYVEESPKDRPYSVPRRIRPKSATKSTYVRPTSSPDDTDYDEDDETDDEGVQTILSEDDDEEDEVDEILSDIQDGSTPMDSSEIYDRVPLPSSPPLRTLQLSPTPSLPSQSVDSSPPQSPPEPDRLSPVSNNLKPTPVLPTEPATKSKTTPPPVTKKTKQNSPVTKRVQTAPTHKVQSPQNPQSTPQSRNCCSSARRPRLPAYNGLNSEYGLSAEQLQERERWERARKSQIGEARRLARRLRQQEDKAEQDARRRLSESLFKEWLRRKSVSDIGVCFSRDLHIRDRLPCKRLVAQERNRQKVSGPPATGSSSSVEVSSSNPSTEGSSRGLTPGLVGMRFPSKGNRSRTGWKRVSDPHTVPIAIEDLVRGAPPRLLAACRIYLGLTVR